MLAHGLSVTSATKKTVKCPECESPLALDQSGYLVCTNCGLVVEDSMLLTSLERSIYHKPSMRQRKVAESEEERLRAKLAWKDNANNYRIEVRRLARKYSEPQGWRNAEPFVERLSLRYPFLASALRYVLRELKLESRVRTKGSKRARRFKQVLVDRCYRVLVDGGIHPSFAVKAIREVLEELEEGGLPSYLAPRSKDLERLVEERRQERLKAIRRAWNWSKKVARLLSKIAELPEFQGLDLDVVEQAIRACIGLKHRISSKKKFDLAYEKLKRLSRTSVRRLIDEYNLTIEEVALLKRKSEEKVREAYRDEKFLHKKAKEMIKRVKECMEEFKFSGEAIDCYVRFLKNLGVIPSH